MTSYLIPVFVVAMTVGFISEAWMVIAAFRTGVLWGLACLFLPFFQVFFIFFHWDKAAKPFFLGVCAVLLAAGFLLIYTRSGSPEQREERARSLEQIKTRLMNFKEIKLDKADLEKKIRQLYRDAGRSRAVQSIGSFLNAEKRSPKGPQSQDAIRKAVAMKATRYQQSPTDLIMAVRTGELAEVMRRLEAGDDVNMLSKAGQTPLMEAAAYGYEDMVRYLADKGADLELRNGQGRTALEIAEENYRKSIVAFLERERSLKVALETASVDS